MLNRNTICHYLACQLAFTHNVHRVFGRRFNGDKRYIVKCLAGCGNSAHDEFLVSIGDIRLIVNVNRERDNNTGYYHEHWYTVALADDNWEEDKRTVVIMRVQ